MLYELNIDKLFLDVQIMAYECIPELGRKFRVDVPLARKDCPRMCKRKFKKECMKGFPLDDINEALGSTKVRFCKVNGI